MLRPEKEDIVKRIRDEVSRAAGVYFVDFTGLTVAEAEGLRRKYREKTIATLQKRVKKLQDAAKKKETAGALVDKYLKRGKPQKAGKAKPTEGKKGDE